MTDPAAADSPRPRAWPLATVCLALALTVAYALDVRSRVRTGVGPVELPARWVFDGAHPRVWQLVTYAFVHVDGAHLRGNLLALVFAGLCVERRLGARRTAWGALGVTVAACLGFHALDPRDLYGASGAASGLVALAGALWIRADDTPPRARTLVTVGVAAFFGLSEALPALLGHPNVGWRAHLPGALAGLLAGLTWRWRHRPRGTARGAPDRTSWTVAWPFLVGGVALGLGVRHPALAWVGTALTAFGLSRDTAPRPRAWGIVVGSLVACALRLDFLWAGFAAYMPAASAHRWAAGVVLGVAFINRAPTAWISLRWRRASSFVPLWFPAATLCGEWLWAQATHLPLDAWLLTQGRTAPVLHLVAWIGYTPTALLSLTLGASVGASLARAGRARAMGIGLCALAAALACAVPARRRGAGALRGVVALRMNRSVGELPAMPGAELVVWPETSVRWPLAIPREGAVEGVRLPRMMRGDVRAEHLIGAFNRPPGITHNAAVLVGPDGDVRWMRAKRILMPVGEAPYLGAMLPNVRAYTPGRAAPVTRAAGRAVGVLVCLELFDRAQVARAVGSGVELLAVLSGDTLVGQTASGRELVVSVSALVAAEHGVAVARSSWRGVALLVGPDGAVLARSDVGHLRNVAWSPARD